MEKRRESRYTAGQPVVVAILSGEPSTHRAIVNNGSGKGIALEMPVPVAAGAALKIEWDDTLLLGEAVYCAPRQDHFLVGVLLEAKISQLSRLAEILEAFADGRTPAREPA